MVLRITCFCLFLLLKAWVSYSQLQPSFRVLTSDDGLCNDYIRCLHQDKTGFFWIGTYDGLSRFDGRNFITFRRNLEDTNSLPSNTILDIAEDNFGMLWLSTGKGICYLEKHTQQVHRLDICPEEPVFYSYDLKVDQNNYLWFTTQRALCQYKIIGKGSIRPVKRYLFPITNSRDGAREKVFTDNKGNAFVIKGELLFMVTADSLKLLTISDRSTKNFFVKSICQDQQGNYWLGNADRPQLLVLDTQLRLRRVVDIPSNHLASDDLVHKIKLISKGTNGLPQLWCGTYRSGLVVYDLTSNRFVSYKHHPQQSATLNNDNVNAFCETKDGILWIGTGYGLSLYDPFEQQLQTVSLWLPPDPGDRITDAVQDKSDKDIYWLGTTNRGLVRFNISNWSMAIISVPESARQIQYIYQSKNGDVFVGCEKGLYVKENGNNCLVRLPEPLGNIRSVSCMLEIEEGRYIISSFEDGCFIYDHAKKTSSLFNKEKGLFSNRCTHLSRSADGHVYITHIATGISILNPNDKTIRSIDLQQYLEKELKFPATFTYCSYLQGDSLLWIGTGLGLMRFDLKKQQGGLVPATTRLKTDNEIWSIVPSYPFLWLKTTFGIYKFNQLTNSVVSFFALNRQHIQAQEGYFRLRSYDSIFVIPAHNGFYFFNPYYQQRGETSENVVLLNIKINGKIIYFKPEENINLELQPHEQNIELNFAAINFRRPEFTTYSYSMEGAGDKWFNLGAKSSLSFPNLKAGKYLLKIKAQDFEGRETLRPLLISINLQPFFWQTLWFFLLLIMVVSMVFYLAYRYRLKQMLATQRVRLKISKDLHDDIGATISSIGILSNMAKESTVDEQKKHQFMERIAKDSKYVAESLSDIVWTINPKNDTLEMIFIRLFRYAYELFEAKNIRYNVQLPEETIKYLSLKMEDRQHLYLILKEVVNNLVKYSMATEVSIIVSYQKPFLSICVRDNGVGFNQNEAKGNGLQNIHKRSAELKGEVTIDSRRGFGTTITLVIPIKKYQKM